MRCTHLLVALIIAASAATAATAEKPAQPAALTAKATAAGKAKAAPQYKGPTEADIRVAYTNKISAVNAGTQQYLDAKAAAKLTIRLVKVNYVECDPVEDRTDLYLCNVLVESAVGDAGVEFKRVELALFKEKDAWRIN